MQHPFLDKTLHIKWSTLKPEHVEADIAAALKDAQERIDAVVATPLKSVTLANTLRALDNATEDLTRAWGYVSHLDSVSNSSKLRAAYNAMLPRVSDFYTSIPLNAALWERIRAFAETNEAQALEGVNRRWLDETLADFRENGADLPDDKKQRLQAINNELSRLTQKYSENVLDSTNAWELLVDDPEMLRGLPHSALAAALEDARAKGHGEDDKPVWRFTQQMTSILPVMKYGDSNDLRKAVWEGSNTIGTTGDYNNNSLIWDILTLRQEKAELLDKPHFPDFVLPRRMAKNGKAALAFIEDMHVRVKMAFDAEVDALAAFKAEMLGQPKEPLEPWETAYWAEQQRRKLFAFDEEALRPYFPIENVISGMFGIAEKLFGVTIERTGTRYIDPETGEEQTFPVDSGELVEVWHPEVNFYRVLDSDGAHIGSFYADWHPRDSKRSGAWMNYLRTGGPTNGAFEPHLGLMCGNMSKPTGGKPALMTHNEVETIFHEFGHLLHHLLSRVPVKSLSGVNVAWDFVELPSQLMENWCWNREALDGFARHYDTGEPIPPELLDKMLAARNYMEASTTMRQLSLAKMDLELHLNAKFWQGRELEPLIDDILQGYRATLKTKAPSLVRRFSHLFSDPTGYASGYYSYKWAEVLDADAFTRFEAEGVFNGETGRTFRKAILERGNSAPPETLFHDFMGRDPDPEALLKRSGIGI